MAIKAHYLALLLPLASFAMRASTARADDRQECLDAHAQGQNLQDAQKLVEAREKFRACANARCPEAVQSTCVELFESVQRDLPTIVLSATDTTGAKRRDVAVTVDGAPFAATLEGVARAINPGTHRFHFQCADGRGVDLDTVVAEGQKDQSIVGALPPAAPVPSPRPAATVAPPSPAPPVAPPSAETTVQGGGRGKRVAGFALGGAGIVGLGIAIGFGAKMASDTSTRLQLCPQGMPCGNQAAFDADHSARVSQLVMFVSGGVGLAALGAGAFLLLAAKSGSAAPPASASGVYVAPRVGPGSAGVDVSGSF